MKCNAMKKNNLRNEQSTKEIDGEWYGENRHIGF